MLLTFKVFPADSQIDLQNCFANQEVDWLKKPLEPPLKPAPAAVPGGEEAA
jgi:hypothetical protein